MEDDKNYRNHPMTEQTLRQFLNHDGPKGASEEYKARWEYTFRLTDIQRIAVDELVLAGDNIVDAVRRVTE